MDKGCIYILTFKNWEKHLHVGGAALRQRSL
jgi:hypothetical protein